ncbi:LOW QUALITY PROTEIN: Hypothetical protein PHPALM_37668 [Phytophthora palmivora]|uniref:Uncharacterized protein n=1 Tax=Phytophthora palmivora TaxID=4796 RepID=A0A2P4WWU4_9STRA|nr:LOW QUALITY PROTEIN: Hypothetical protein PHPALM_37668 [Phytophthora palmivora]
MAVPSAPSVVTSIVPPAPTPSSGTPLKAPLGTSPPGRPLRTAAATARQVDAQLLENLGTSDTLALRLGDGLSGAVGTQPNSSGSVSHPLELSSDSADDDQPGAADSAVGASTADGDAPAEPASTTAKLSRLAQLFGSEDESDSSDSGDSDSADGPLTPVVTSSGPPQGKVQSYLAAGQKRRKEKKKYKHKHKHKAAHKGRHKSKREDRHKGRRKETKSQAKRPRSPSPGEPSASDAGAPLKKHKVSTRSPAAANSATDSAAGPEPSPNSAGGSGAPPNSAGVTLPSQLSVSIAVLRTRAMQSASRDSLSSVTGLAVLPRRVSALLVEDFEPSVRESSDGVSRCSVSSSSDVVYTSRDTGVRGCL